MSIDPTFVDVDFPSQGYATGVIAGDKPVDGMTLYGDAESVLKPDELKDIARDPNYTGCEFLATRIYNQNGDPSCVSNAFAQAMEILQALQFGLAKVTPLSQLSLYKRVGSARSGSSLSDNLREVRTRGVLPLDTPQNREKFKHVGPEHGYGRYSLPSGWEETGKLFTASEFLRIDNKWEFYSALAKNQPVIYARAGHSIVSPRLVWDDGKFLRKYFQSWGKWGTAIGNFPYGAGFDSERAGGFQWAVALRSVTVNSLQGPQP